ncbi:Uma2 family endonuclease [Nonomuraea basaltis]|uniref:Uma2 family endonuclease n=1 Tax=Nonomuraea basaltis TaxID=2495887 RepID=UPI00110C6EFE|nr:Uma2 family endonuclease [Nonomuraea basaltis]TMS00741.1 Uma2 family endonuclease [Nonomuraea basaltis]
MVRPLEERFRTVRDLLPEHRVERTAGRIVVNESGTWQHNRIMSRLLFQIVGTVAARGWEIWPNITVYLGEHADQYVPDLAVVPCSPRMEEDHAVHGDSTVLLVDVVSTSSTYDDYFVKPRGYAPAGVPLYLLIDPFQDAVRLFSEPAGPEYGRQTVAGAGERLLLPAPWGFALDTGELLD